VCVCVCVCVCACVRVCVWIQKQEVQLNTALIGNQGKEDDLKTPLVCTVSERALMRFISLWLDFENDGTYSKIVRNEIASQTPNTRDSTDQAPLHAMHDSLGEGVHRRLCTGSVIHSNVFSRC